MGGASETRITRALAAVHAGEPLPDGVSAADLAALGLVLQVDGQWRLTMDGLLMLRLAGTDGSSLGAALVAG